MTSRHFAVVTGASSGIGRELAREFAAGVTVTSLMPGPTDTEFFERADMLDTKVGAADKDDAADVARQGFEAMMAGKDRVVAASLSTKLQSKGSRFLPDATKAALQRDMAEPGAAR